MLKGQRVILFYKKIQPVRFFSLRMLMALAPISSLIEHALALDMAASFHLYWIASSNNGHYQNNQRRAWADAL